jgi:hypothetical protein
MRENEPVLLVLSVCDGKIILEKGEILYEKCHLLNSIGGFQSSGCIFLLLTVSWIMATNNKYS